jgi:hypothetical protein
MDLPSQSESINRVIEKSYGGQATNEREFTRNDSFLFVFIRVHSRLLPVCAQNGSLADKITFR